MFEKFMQVVAFWLIFTGLTTNAYWLLKWIFSAKSSAPTPEEVSEYHQKVITSAQSLCRVGYQNASGETLDVYEIRQALWKVAKDNAEKAGAA